MGYYLLNENDSETPMKPTHPLLTRIMPFLMLAFILFILIIGIFLFSYILIFALIVGFILFIIGYVRAKFFGHQSNAIHEEFIMDIKREQNKPEHIGRIIEHENEENNK